MNLLSHTKYEKVLKIKEEINQETQKKIFKYFIHYKGWNERYGERYMIIANFQK